MNSSALLCMSASQKQVYRTDITNVSAGRMKVYGTAVMDVEIMVKMNEELLKDLYKKVQGVLWESCEQ